MTSIANGHLTDEQLLFYADGELGSGDSERVRGHLEACWTCRAKFEDLQEAIKKIVDFRNQVLLLMLPAPPRPWDGLEPQMRELDGRLEKASVAERLSHLLRFGILAPRYVVFAVLVLAVLIAFVCLPSQPVTSANELLARVQAAQAADLGRVTAPVLYERLQVRRTVAGSTEQATTNYESWRDPFRGRFRQRGASAALLTELRTICNANQLDWQAPLSAAGFARWRNSLPAKQDTVAPANVSAAGGVNNGAEPLVLTTIAGSQAANSLRTEDVNADKVTKAEVVVRVGDWRPVEERLWVKDREYEIAELFSQVLPLADVDLSVFAEPPAAPIERVPLPLPVLTETPERLLPPPPDPQGTEMAVRYGLHQLDADLGDLVEISRGSQGQVIVNVSGVAPELQAKFKQQLASIPNTRLELNRSPSRARDARSAPSQESVAPVVNPNEKRLAEIFGHPHAQESFAKEVLAVSGDALAQAFALQELARRYTAEEEAKLTPIARVQLEAMVGDHIAALNEQTSRLQGLLRPLLEALSNSSTTGVKSPDVTAQEARSDEAGGAVGAGLQTGSSPDFLLPNPQWQDVSLELYATAQGGDGMIKSLLTSTKTPKPAEQVVPELRRALSKQQQELNHYQGHVRQVSKAAEK